MPVSAHAGGEDPALSNRVILLLVVLMCGSFAAVLGLMWSAVSPNRVERPRPRSLRIMREAPADELVGGGIDGTSATRRDKTLRAATARFEIPQDAATPPAQLMSADEVDLPEDPELERRARAAADLASRHLDKMENRLKRQIRVLEESRNGMLDDLALELQGLAPREAARSLAILDDETAAMALVRLPQHRRKQVMAALGPEMARRLKKKLNAMGHN